MLVRASRFRPRTRPGLGTEGLEIRRLLTMAPIDVAANLPIASGLPLPGLASGLGLATTATLPSTAVSVAPVVPSQGPLVMPSVPTATGPATTLSPLMNDAETANAAASEVARPTPGRSDRISSLLFDPLLIPIPHLSSPDDGALILGPEQLHLVPVDPVQRPASPDAEPAQPAAERTLTEISDEAIARIVADADVVVLDEPEETASDAVMASFRLASLERPAEAGLAAGVMLVAWAGWRWGPSPLGRSRRRAVLIEQPSDCP